MYKAVPDHPKFATFKFILKLNKAAAVGYLELLWHFAGRYALAGNVGRFSDAEIESSLDWDGEPGALIAALVASRWLDRSEGHRLVVHHWAHWADETVHTQLARKCETFADGTIPHSGRLNAAERTKFNSAFVEKDATQGPDNSDAAEVSQDSADGQPQVSHRSAVTQIESAIATVVKPSPTPRPQPLKTNNPMSDDIALAAVVVSDKDKSVSAPKRALRKEQREAVERLFAYFLAGTDRNPKMYELTPARMDKGLARLEDCQRKCGGDLVKAEKLMGLAIDALIASDFHAGNNDRNLKYTDWINHLFKSTEKLEFWLAR